MSTAESILFAIREYERECYTRMRERSQEVFGHPGASIASLAPQETGRIAAIERALREASPPEYVHCGCDYHGDHAGCTASCDLLGCDGAE